MQHAASSVAHQTDRSSSVYEYMTQPAAAIWHPLEVLADLLVLYHTDDLLLLLFLVGAAHLNLNHGLEQAKASGGSLQASMETLAVSVPSTSWQCKLKHHRIMPHLSLTTTCHGRATQQSNNPVVTQQHTATMQVPTVQYYTVDHSKPC